MSSHVLVIYQPGRSPPPPSPPCDRSLSLCAKSLQSCPTLCDALGLGGKIHWRRDRLPTSHHSRAFLVAQLVKNPPAVWETWVQSLGWEGSLEKGMATHSSILAWRIPWTVYSMGSQRVGHDWAIFTFHAYIKFLCMYKFYIYRLCHRACGILVPRLEIEPTPCTVKVWSPNHWTVRELVLKWQFSQSLFIALSLSPSPLWFPPFF